MTVIVVRDLVSGRQGSVVTPDNQVTAMTVTETKLAFACRRDLHVIPLAELVQEIGLEDEMIQTSHLINPIYRLAGFKDVLAVLSHHNEKTSLQFWRQGVFDFVLETRCIADVEVDSEYFLLTYEVIDNTSWNGSLTMKKYSFDGVYLGDIVSRRCASNVYMKHNGNEWSGVTPGEGGLIAQQILSASKKDVEYCESVLWKDRMYLAEKGNIEVSTMRHLDGTLMKDKLIGNLVFLGDYDIELLVDDSFLVVCQKDKKIWRHRWSVFTFDDLPCLPGIEIGQEVVAGRYFWQPAKTDGADHNGWTCYGRGRRNKIAAQDL